MIKDTIISGIICEFNPLHNGHSHILQKMNDVGFVICVMSGNFVQRGEPAIIDKWTRAKLALKSGADLVLELPLPFATAGAEAFALGGVGILDSLNCVDNLWFGSECGNTDILKKIADLLTTNKLFAPRLQEKLQNGVSFAEARELTVMELMGNEYNNELSGANNILAVEYLKAILTLQSVLVPKTIIRIGSMHDAYSNEKIASAMQIRKSIIANTIFESSIPNSTLYEINKQIKTGKCPTTISRLERAILAKLRNMSTEDFSRLPDISEGIENKISKSIKTAISLDELYSQIKSKRYSHARVRRLVLHAFLGITADMQKLEYVKILAMNKNGETILKNAKKSLPLIGKMSDLKNLNKEAQRSFYTESLADDMYALSAPIIQKCGLTFTKKIIKE